MDAYQLAYPARCRGACVRGSLHSAHVASYHNGHQASANHFLAQQCNVCSFYHCIGCLNGTNQSFCKAFQIGHISAHSCKHSFYPV